MTKLKDLCYDAEVIANNNTAKILETGGYYWYDLPDCGSFSDTSGLILKTDETHCGFVTHCGNVQFCAGTEFHANEYHHGCEIHCGRETHSGEISITNDVELDGSTVTLCGQLDLLGCSYFGYSGCIDGFLEYHYTSEYHYGTEEHHGYEYHEGAVLHGGCVSFCGDEYHGGCDTVEYHYGHEEHKGDVQYYSCAYYFLDVYYGCADCSCASGNEYHYIPEFHDGGCITKGCSDHIGCGTVDSYYNENFYSCVTFSGYVLHCGGQVDFNDVACHNAELVVNGEYSGCTIFDVYETQDGDSIYCSTVVSASTYVYAYASSELCMYSCGFSYFYSSCDTTFTSGDCMYFYAYGGEYHYGTTYMEYLYMQNNTYITFEDSSGITTTLSYDEVKKLHELIDTHGL